MTNVRPHFEIQIVTSGGYSMHAFKCVKIGSHTQSRQHRAGSTESPFGKPYSAENCLQKACKLDSGQRQEGGRSSLGLVDDYEYGGCWNHYEGGNCIYKVCGRDSK